MRIQSKRYFKVVKKNSIDELADTINQLVDDENIKIVNYTIEQDNLLKMAILFYEKTDEK